MVATINLYSNKEGELNKFLSKFYNSNFNDLQNSLNWKKDYKNPIEIADMVGTFVDNIDSFSLCMWICLDKDVFINVTSQNADDIIRYLYERFPY